VLLEYLPGAGARRGRCAGIGRSRGDEDPLRGPFRAAQGAPPRESAATRGLGRPWPQQCRAHRRG
jgi:hypothetical protein